MFYVTFTERSALPSKNKEKEWLWETDLNENDIKKTKQYLSKEDQKPTTIKICHKHRTSSFCTKS